MVNSWSYTCQKLGVQARGKEMTLEVQKVQLNIENAQTFSCSRVTYSGSMSLSPLSHLVSQSLILVR